MKILQIIPNLAGGGAERFVVDIANELAKDNTVYLCTLYHMQPGKNDFFLSELSAKVKHISLGKKMGLDFSLFKKMSALIDEIQPDVVNTHLASINYVILKSFFAKLKKSRTRYFHTLHSEAKAEIKNKLEYFTRRQLYKLKLVTPVTISEESRQSFRAFYKLNCDELIYNGRKKEQPTPVYPDVLNEVNSYKITNATKVLINIGRFVALKNQITIAKVVNQLASEGQDVILLIIGNYDSAEGESIKQSIEALKFQNVYLLGTKHNVVDYLKACDAFCICSLYEGMPISLIEAMAAGCIPICTPVGGIPTVITFQDGYVSKDLSEKEIKKAIAAFLNASNEQNYALKANLIKLFNSRFNITSTAGLYLNAYAK